MTPFNSLEQAQQSGAREILLDAQTRRFWADDSPIAVRAAVRAGMSHASAGPVVMSPAQAQALELLEPGTPDPVWVLTDAPSQVSGWPL